MQSNSDAVWLDVLIEIIINLAISLAPFWLAAVIIYFSASNDDKPLADAALSLVIKGDLFIYSATLLAPTFWMINQKTIASIRMRAIVTTLSAIILLVSATAYSLIILGTVLNPTATKYFSPVILFISTVILYFVTYTHHTPFENPGSLIRRDETDFTRAFQKHRVGAEIEGDVNHSDDAEDTQ